MLLGVAVCGAKTREEAFQEFFARQIGGELNARAADGSRCEILTETHAIELAMAKQAASAIGASLDAGLKFGREPGIVLVLEERSDEQYFVHLGGLLIHYELPIQLYAIRAYEGEGPTDFSGDPAPAGKAPDAPQDDVGSGDFWISSTGKTHVPGCRYYGQGNGEFADRPSGNDCKICGGTSQP